MIRIFKELLPNTINQTTLITLFSTMVSLAIVKLMSPILKQLPQQYLDIIVGNITWSDYNKTYEYNLVYLFFICFVIIWVTSSFVTNRYWVKATSPIILENQINLMSVVLTIGLSYVFTLSLMQSILPKVVEPLIFCVISSLGYFIFAKANLINNDTLKHDFSERFIGVILLSIFFGFSVLGIIAFLKFLFPTAFIENIKFVKYSLIISVVLGLVIGCSMVFRNNLKKYLLFSQIFTPALIIIVVNGIYQQGNTITSNNISFFTKCFVIICILYFVLYNFYKAIIFFRQSDQSPRINNLIFWPTVVSISIFINFKIPGYSALIGDDFHMAELMLPWEQVMGFGQNLYSEYVSVQGLLGLIYGGINNIFFSGTASSFPLAMTFLAAFFAGLSAYLLCRFVGSGWGLVLSLIPLPIYSDRFYLVLPVILILAHPKLLRKPINWLITWASLSLFHVFFSPSVGAALTISTSVIALFIFINSLKQGLFKKVWEKNKTKKIFFLATSFMFIIFLFPLILELLNFLKENGQSNVTAYGMGILQYSGIPEWFPKWFSPLINHLLWEGLRIGGWLFGIVILWYLIVINYLRFRLKDDRTLSIIVLALMTVIFAVAIIPYSMGRIEPAAMSRTGMVSMLIIGMVLPIVIAISRSNYKIITLILMGILLGIRASIFSIQLENLSAQATATIPVPLEAKFVKGEEIGIPKLGNIFIMPAKLDELNKFNAAIQFLLKDNETYFDFTNRSAYYYLFDKKVPGVYSTDYLTVNYEIQMRTINALKNDVPAVVWLGPSIRFDGVSASLRSYRIYRWLMEHNYQYYEDRGFQFMIREDRFNELGLSKKSDIENTQNLAKIFYQKDLQSIPIAWGRNLPDLQERFQNSEINMKNVKQTFLNGINLDKNGEFNIIGIDPFIVWNLNKLVNGRNADFLEISIESSNNSNYRGQVFWSDLNTEFSEDRSFVFNLKDGKILIPLGSHPDWIKNSSINRLRFDIDNNTGNKFKISSIQFLKLVN